MRMWLVDPKIMCKKHLLGEHVEIHMLLGSLNKKKNIQGFLDKGLVEPSLIKQRHDELVFEMLVRGWNHKTPIDQIIAYPKGFVDKEKSLQDLIGRCPECKKNWENLK